ncbi:MAG TPA: type IV secretion protein IcmL [Legionella sp.]|nr:type IV secretion protein IcmL [Legionella sp.]
MKPSFSILMLLTLLGPSTHADTVQAIKAPAAPKPVIESTAPTAPKPTPVINCEYPIPADVVTVDNALLSTWATKAAMQSFDFNAPNIDSQLGQLKLCYTTQGWQGFMDALTKSGNVDAIKLQHLTVSSQVDGNVTVNPVKENQWKIAVPLHVVYQNEKERLTQLLSIELLVGRNASGTLGIMQIIATPREAAVTPP